MKKLFLLLVVSFFATGVFAQEWSVGGRVGSGFQAVGQYNRNSYEYVEARFGAYWCGGVTADFTALYNWRIAEMDWTPNAGIWFFDAGVGVNTGGASHYAYVGVAGMARLGYKFKKAPISLSIDYTPVIGPEFAYGIPSIEGDIYTGDVYMKNKTFASYYEAGLFNAGITCTFHF